jgi:hypothetical protein
MVSASVKARVVAAFGKDSEDIPHVPINVDVVLASSFI